MSNPVWPGSLPPSWGGKASRDPGDNTIRSQMEIGPAKARPRSSADTIAISFVLRLDRTEWKTLDDFYLVDCKKTLPFDWKDFADASEPTATFRFMRRPKAVHDAGPYWNVTIDMEQLP